MKAKENNGKSKKEVAIRNIYFCAYLISKGIPLKYSDVKETHTIWYFDYDEEIFALQKQFYTDTWLQQFIGALKELKTEIINTRRTYGKNNQ
jgi:hypothetical protein